MKKFPLDLSKFKKVSSDKHTTTLRHEDGHEIRLAHNALEPKLRGKLAELQAEKPVKMAKGGEVKDDVQNINPKDAKDFEKGSTSSGIGYLKEGFENAKRELGFGKKSHSGDVARMADGGEVASQIVADLESGKNSSSIEDQMSLPKTSDPLVSEATSVAPQQEIIPATTDRQIASVPSQVQASSVMVPSQGQTINSVDTGIAPDAIQQQPSNVGLQDTLGNQQNILQDAYSKQVTGIQQGAAAEGALGKQQAALLNDQAIRQQRAQAHFESVSKDLADEREALQHDIANSHIDPTHYLGSMSTAGRVSTAIGLILGGVGGGLTHGPNQALSYLNSQIDRDIDAQKANLGKKESLLNANFRQFGNLKDATEMTRVMMADTIGTQLKAAAEKAQDPIVRARALQAAGQIEQAVAPQFQAFQMNRSMISAAQQDAKDGSGTSAQEAMLPYLRVINPEKAKEIETRLVPGVGMATVPVTSEVRTNLTAKQTLDHMAKDFYQWTSKNSGSLDPRVINEGKTKAAELQSLYRNSINGGVFKKGEQEFIDQIVDSDPTKFFNSIRVLPKLKEVIDSNSSQLSTLKKSYGLPVQSREAETMSALSPQQQSFVKFAKENPNDPRSAMILKKLGL